MKKISRFAFVLLILAALIVPSVLVATPISAEDPVAITVPVTYRDFHPYDWTNYGHPDFQRDYLDYVDSGIVQSTLGSDHKPVYNSATTHPTIYPSVNPEEYFNMWYNNTANYNMSKADSLTFTWNGTDNVFEYQDDTFFPLDGELFGNDGNTHNYHFTMEMHTSFTYQTGQKFSFSGDDDVWVFINNQRVIDLGGIHNALSASIDLDTLGLTSGNNYNFDLFFAERRTTESHFKAQTNILFTPPVPELPSGFLFGLGLLGICGVIVVKKYMIDVK